MADKHGETKVYITHEMCVTTPVLAEVTPVIGTHRIIVISRSLADTALASSGIIHIDGTGSGDLVEV